MAPEVSDPRDQGPDALLAWAAGLGVADAATRRLLSAILLHGEHDPAAWGRRFAGPPRPSDRLPPLPRLALERSVVSPRDGFQKLLFRLHDGLAVETVLIPL